MDSSNEEDEAGSSRNEHPEIITRDDSLVGENSEDIELHPEVIDTHQSSETMLRQGEVVGGNKSRKSSRKHVEEAKTEGETQSETSGSGSFSSTSSRSLSLASSEDLFQVDTSKFIPKLSVTVSNKPNEALEGSIRSPGTSSSHTSQFIPKLSVPVSNKPNEASEGSIRSPGTSSSQDSNSIHEPPLNHSMSLSPIQTPPTQVMDRSDGDDSSRVSTPVITTRRWSAASNDSLFSIQVGATSFSREQFLFGDQEKSGDAERYSGEFGKSDEPSNKSGEFFVFSPPKPVSVLVPASEIDGKSVETARNSEASRVVDEPIIGASRRSAQDVPQQPNSPGTPSCSDESSSSHPFANPGVKKKKSRFPFCSCFNCNWKLCHCSLPSCCARRPNCHCPDCSWMSCCSWNSTKKMLCCSCCFSKGSSNDEEHKKKQKHKPLQQTESPRHKGSSKSSGYQCFPSYNCCRNWLSCRCFR